MVQNMRRISLFVLIAFTFSTLFFQVVNVTYAENDDNSDLEERVEQLEKIVKEQGEQIKQLKDKEKVEEPETDRGIVDTLVDIGKFTVGSCVAAVGAVGVTCSTVSGAATFGLSAPISIPAAIVSGGAVIGGGATAWSASNNLVNDVVNLFSGDDDDDDDDDD